MDPNTGRQLDGSWDHQVQVLVTVTVLESDLHAHLNKVHDMTILKAGETNTQIVNLEAAYLSGYQFNIVNQDELRADGWEVSLDEDSHELTVKPQLTVKPPSDAKIEDSRIITLEVLHVDCSRNFIYLPFVINESPDAIYSPQGGKAGEVLISANELSLEQGYALELGDVDQDIIDTWKVEINNGEINVTVPDYPDALAGDYISLPINLVTYDDNGEVLSTELESYAVFIKQGKILQVKTSQSTRFG